MDSQFLIACGIAFAAGGCFAYGINIAGIGLTIAALAISNA